MISLLDIPKLLTPHYSSLLEGIGKVVHAGQFINGPQVEEFEKACAEYIGVKHFIGLSSGTDALLASFMALDLDAEDEVIVTPFTFISSVTSIVRAGLKPVFCDIHPDKFVPTLEEIQKVWTPRTKAVLVVHLYGEVVEVGDIKDWCRGRGVVLLEDCAQTLGGRTASGSHVGTQGLAGAFSFFPAKNLGCFGDGGGVSTNDSAFAQKIKHIRSHGCPTKYYPTRLGGNFRLDTIQAAILNTLLPHLDKWLLSRRANALYYEETLNDIDSLQLPFYNSTHTWNQYTICTPERDELKKYLDENKIGNAIYYPTPLNRTPIFTQLPMKESEKRCLECLSIPVSPSLSEEEREQVSTTIRGFFE